MLDKNYSSPAYLNGCSPELSYRGSPSGSRKIYSAAAKSPEPTTWKSENLEMGPVNLSPQPKIRVSSRLDEMELPQSKTLTALA